MNIISLCMPMGQETMGDLWTPECLSEITHLNRGQKYACTNLDMDYNASSHRYIKWTVKYDIQSFCKSSSHINKNMDISLNSQIHLVNQ